MNITIKCSKCKEDLQIVESYIDLYHDTTYFMYPCGCSQDRIHDFISENSKLEDDIESLRDAIKDALVELGPYEAQISEAISDLRDALI